MARERDVTVARLVEECPACGNSKFDQIGTAAERFKCDGCAPFSQPSYVIFECQECGLYFKSHTLTFTALTEYYKNLDFESFNLPYTFPTDEKLLSVVRRLSPGSRILDFGCSAGRLLGLLGAEYERFGVEVNTEAAALAKERGLAIITEEDLAEDRCGKFDAIIFTDVFEHLVDPTSVVGLLIKSLKPGGNLLIVTGLADSIKMRDCISEYWYFRLCGHLHMLSRRHLEWLSTKFDLTITEVKQCCHYRRSPVRLAKQIAQSLSYRALRKNPDSHLAKVLQHLPVFNRAKRWTNLPPTHQFRDHVVAILSKNKT